MPFNLEHKRVFFKNPIHYKAVLWNVIILLVLIFVNSQSAFAQAPPDCPVIARMTPEGDSVLYTPTVVTFQDASINASSYHFIIDEINYPVNQPVTIAIEVGLKMVTLVASNGTCSDTATAYYFYPGEFPVDINHAIKSYGEKNKTYDMAGLITSADGGQVMYGRKLAATIVSLDPQHGMVIKTKRSGCIEWAKKITQNSILGSSVEMVKESPDRNMYMFSTFNTIPQLTKLDAAGNIVWTQALKYGTPGAFQYFRTMEVLPDGGVVTVSSNFPATRSFALTRFNPNGQIAWQRSFDTVFLSSDYMNRLLYKNGYLYVGGYFGVEGFPIFNTGMLKIDCSNGQTVWSKKYSIGSTPFSIGDMASSGSTIVMNIFAATGDPNRPPIGGMMRLDTNGVVLSASIIADIYVPNTFMGPYISLNSRMTMSGKNFYINTAGYANLTLQGDGRSTRLIRFDSSLQVKWVSSDGGIGSTSYLFNAPADRDGVVLGGNSWGPALASYPYGTLFKTVPLDSNSNNPGICNRSVNTWQTFYPTITVDTSLGFISDPATNYAEAGFIPWDRYYPEMRYNCPDYVDSCSFLKISGATSVCNLSQSYLYRSHKNKACGRPVSWAVSPGVQVVGSTDSTLSVKFLQFGSHTIYGRDTLSCFPIEDSITIAAAPITPVLNLGGDLEICPDNNTTLHAGHYYFNYEWNNGTTDSTLIINQPGQYWVKVTDSCNNIMYDTVVVSLAPPVPFSIGNDREICINDTVNLSATPGFLSYQWNPPYQLSSTTGQTNIANPLIDTTYTVIAEKTPGCFAYDSMHITVHLAPPLYLGTDKNICAGDSLVLNAGNSFASYQWNNGEATSLIKVKDQGTYSVIATTANGCKVYDTLSVLNVFTLPVPQLDHSSILCDKVSRLLDAGSGFTQYVWNTGESTAQINVTSLGNYSVTVSDQNGCKGADSVNINLLQPVPSLFLPADFSKCFYETAVLKPLITFNNYTWNTGSNAESIQVTEPGLYWLQVTDRAGCKGTDSIEVLAKNDCMRGIYVPNSFTPNDDGKNDLFKPLIYGTIKLYAFEIYNRWGAVVFKTTDPRQGWDGKLKGVKQNGNSFVWRLTYQLEGRQIQNDSGTVLLIR